VKLFVQDGGYKFATGDVLKNFPQRMTNPTGSCCATEQWASRLDILPPSMMRDAALAAELETGSRYGWDVAQH